MNAKTVLLAGKTMLAGSSGGKINAPSVTSSGATEKSGTFRFCCLTISNVAVSAMAITAITPAWTGSDTTRSATSGTLPAMFSEITMRPFCRTSWTAFEISPPISEPASTRSRTRGRRTTARTALASSLSPTSGMVSIEIRSPRMLCRSASVMAPSAT